MRIKKINLILLVITPSILFSVSLFAKGYNSLEKLSTGFGGNLYPRLVKQQGQLSDFYKIESSLIPSWIGAGISTQESGGLGKFMPDFIQDDRKMQKDHFKVFKNKDEPKRKIKKKLDPERIYTRKERKIGSVGR